MSENVNCSETSNKMPKVLIESLSFNQAGVGRHKCVICAYQIGIIDGEKKALDFAQDNDIVKCKHGRKALSISINTLHDNQASSEGRHKCAICAYHLGYELGQGDMDNDYDEFNEDELIDTSLIYDITTFGTSADVMTINNRLKKGKYYIPSFQRDYVWKIPQASRLIESIVMGLPIPAIFMAKDEGKGENYYIIDGQQRLKSIQMYLNNEFALKDVIDGLSDKTYDELDETYRDRIDEYALQLIIIKQEKPDNENDSIYKIFERINTEGTKLYPQEIRSSSYHGVFNELLHQFARDPRWVDFIKMKNSRKSHEELILRFFALNFDIDNYKAPMKHFLNIYMNKNRNFKYTNKEEVESIFDKVIDIFSKHLLKEHICLIGSNRVNTQLLDSIFIGIAKNLDNPNLENDGYLVGKINELKENINTDGYQYREYWESRASHMDNVKGRCNITIELFSE